MPFAKNSLEIRNGERTEKYSHPVLSELHIAVFPPYNIWGAEAIILVYVLELEIQMLNSND